MLTKGLIDEFWQSLKKWGEGGQYIYATNGWQRWERVSQMLTITDTGRRKGLDPPKYYWHYLWAVPKAWVTQGHFFAKFSFWRISSLPNKHKKHIMYLAAVFAMLWGHFFPEPPKVFPGRQFSSLVAGSDYCLDKRHNTFN